MKERVISAVVALAICIPLIALGGMWFLILVSLIGILALRELISLEKTKNPMLMEIVAYVSLILLIGGENIFSTFSKCLCIVTLVQFLPIIFYKKETYNFKNAISLYAPVVFLGFVFNLMLQIRNGDIYAFLFVILIPIFTDTFAYIVGKYFGKHKLLPKVSPNKTIEGCVGGALAAIIGASIFYIFEVDPSANIFIIILVVLALSIIGQLGDLFFSSIKRYYNIKDFSNIMPGHGGVLDRIDSIIFVVLLYSILF